MLRDPLRSLPGYALKRASSAALSDLAERLAPLALRHTDVSVLLLIDANPGLTSSELGRSLDIQRANMTPLIARLADRQLITRSQVDGRSQALALTEDGRALLAQARTLIDRFEADLIARIPAEHRDHFIPALMALWSRD